MNVKELIELIPITQKIEINTLCCNGMYEFCFYGSVAEYKHNYDTYKVSSIETRSDTLFILI